MHQARELTMQEIDETSGGDGVVTAIVAVGAGIVGTYIYDSMGGHTGINAGFSSWFSSYPAGPSYMSGSGYFG